MKFNELKRKIFQESDKKATIIFNIRYNENNPNLLGNFDFTIKWFLHHYPLKKFDYLIIEQDDISKIKNEYPGVKKVFLYNPDIFNRGWGYNVAVKNYVKTDVSVFCDSDIILEKPYALDKAIYIARKEKKLVSPYNYVYFTNNQERKKILESKEFPKMRLVSDHPVTIAGGIAVVETRKFLEVGGFEEYRVYGGEDRSLDVIFMEDGLSEMINCYGVHLYHPDNKTRSNRSSDMLKHLSQTYACGYSQLNPYDFVHNNCKHITVKSHIQEKIKFFGNKNLYLSKLEDLEINSFPKKRNLNKLNLIITATDEDYFSSFLKLYESLKDTEFHLLILLDLGIKNETIFRIKNERKVKVISFSEEFQKLDKEIGREYFSDIKTYGFKPYLLKNFHAKIVLEENTEYNVLYLDAGVFANKSLDPIFKILSDEDIFCLDHSSEMKYGNIEKKPNLDIGYGDCMLLNILPPPIYKLLSKKYPIKNESLTKQYIKAGIFGYKLNGRYQKLINENLSLFKQTLIGIFPKISKADIPEKDKKILNTQYNLNENLYPKDFYKEKIPSGIEYFSPQSNAHRYDQTILSFLINFFEVEHHSSKDYLITKYQAMNFMKYIFFHAVFLLEEKEKIDRLYQIEKGDTYNLKTMNISENLEKFFTSQYVHLQIDIFDKDRKFFSEDDLIYKKFRFILEISGFENDEFTDRLYYTLMKKWIEQKYKFHKEVLLKIDETYFVLHRNNMIPKKLFIMGNGPSLKEIMDDPVKLERLRKCDTFGLNAAYRAYPRYNFYPKYFGCFDSKVCKHHSEEFEKLITNSPIEKFFFINIGPDGNPIFTKPEILNHPKFVNIHFIFRTIEQKTRNDLISNSYLHFIDMLTSGTNSVQCGIIEGYNEIYLLGCDCNYVEIIEGAEFKDKTLKMVKTPEDNVNYWMKDYQQEGDVFNLPNVSGCQMPAWKRLHDTIKTLNLDVKIFNCSRISKIPYFEKTDF